MCVNACVCVCQCACVCDCLSSLFHHFDFQGAIDDNNINNVYNTRREIREQQLQNHMFNWVTFKNSKQNKTKKRKYSSYFSFSLLRKFKLREHVLTAETPLNNELTTSCMLTPNVHLIWSIEAYLKQPVVLLHVEQGQIQRVSQLRTFHIFVHLQQELMDEGRSLLKVCTQHRERIHIWY